MQSTTIIFLLSLLSFTVSQNSQAADGPIVPFTSVLPACASNCGPLYDVQGKCAPPNIPAVDPTCFCTDTRLTPFDDAGTTGVTQVCGAGIGFCTAASDLQAIKTWYDSYCASNKGVTATSSGASSTSTSSTTSTPQTGGGGNTWLDTHYKWVIMLVVIAFFIIGGWIAASLLRKRYIRRKEKEIEMRPPVAWGPHQLQGMTGGYNYGDGIVDASRGGKSNAGGRNKEAASMVATPANGKRESKGWLTKNRI